MNQDQITAKLSQINSKGLEATFSLSEAALENAQKLAELNYAASKDALVNTCLLYTSPSPRDGLLSRMPSSA